MAVHLRCPYCERSGVKVVDCRVDATNNFIRRRRECCRCGERWTTFEVPRYLEGELGDLLRKTTCNNPAMQGEDKVMRVMRVLRGRKAAGLKSLKKYRP